MRVKRATRIKNNWTKPKQILHKIWDQRKRTKIIILVQVLAIYYLAFLGLAYLVSPTGAYFNDVEVIKNSLHAKWEVPDNDEWDKSSLSFDGSEAGGTCNEIYTTIKNTGEDMTFSTWRYYLYRVDDQGKPVGEAVDSGIVPNIQEGQEGRIASSKVDENTSYRFKVRRPLGHQANNSPDENGYTYITSDNIIHIRSCGDDPEVIVAGEDENIDALLQEDNNEQTEQIEGSEQDKVQEKTAEDNKKQDNEQQPNKENPVKNESEEKTEPNSDEENSNPNDEKKSDDINQESPSKQPENTNTPTNESKEQQVEKSDADEISEQVEELEENNKSENEQQKN